MKSINSGFLKGGVSILLCIYFWLPGVFVAVCELIIVVSPLAGECGSCWGARLLLGTTGSGEHGSCWGAQILFGSQALVIIFALLEASTLVGQVPITQRQLKDYR